MKCSDALEKPKPDFSPVTTILVAAAALVDKEGRILIAQRPDNKSMAGLWEFPGGKIKPGETPEYALMRELEEELGIETRPCCFFPVGFSSHAYDDFHLMMPLFVCRFWKGTVIAKEHKDLRWVKPSSLYDYPMPPADTPLLSVLQDI